MTRTTFEYRVTIDGTDVAGITLAGGTIQYGASGVGEAPSPTTAHLTLISADAAGDLVATYPGISWRGGIPSGYVDTFEEKYEGALSALKIGAPLVIGVATESGYTDIFDANYRAGFDSVRFSGHIVAIDYQPGTVTITGSDEIEKLTRYKIDTTLWPSESELDRLQRIVTIAGISSHSPIGSSSIVVRATGADAKPATPWQLLTELAESCNSVAWVHRSGLLTYRTASAIPSTTYILPTDVTLLDPLTMTSELGDIVNTVTVEYGDSSGSTRPSVSASDAASLAAYGKREGAKRSIIVQEATDAQRYADQIIAAYKDPRWHLPTVQAHLKLARNDGDIGQLLTLDLDDILELPRLLPASPEASYASRVLGYTEALDPEEWIVSYVLDPHGWSKEGITQ